MRDKVSRPYKTTGKIIVLFILVFILFIVHHATNACLKNSYVATWAKGKFALVDAINK
jgi:hypothetical protein